MTGGSIRTYDSRKACESWLRQTWLIANRATIEAYERLLAADQRVSYDIETPRLGYSFRGQRLGDGGQVDSVFLHWMRWQEKGQQLTEGL